MIKNKASIVSFILSSLVFILFVSLGIVLSANNITDPIYTEAMKYVNVVALVFTGLVTIVEFASLFFDKDALLETFLIALGVSAFIIFSKDFLVTINANLNDANLLLTFKILQTFSFYFILFATIRYFRRDYHVTINKRFLIFFYTTIVSLLILQILFVIFKVSVNPIGFISIGFAILFYFYIFTTKKRETDITFVISSVLYFVIIGLVLSHNVVAFIPNVSFARGLDSIGGVTIGLLFISIYLFFVIRTAKKAYQNEVYQKKINELEVIALEEQINPHFVFNSLSLIKSIYRQNAEKGDRAVELLSKHLRTNVDIKSGNMIVPLKDELKNVECFVELSNMGNDKPIRIIYDIDVYDLNVPVLGIEPLVENSIKYSQIQNKEDGYIKISTRENEKEFIISVSDNGVGYNVDEIKEKSKGIKNVKERFEIMLSAKVEIYSKIENGSETVITIPKKR